MSLAYKLLAVILALSGAFGAGWFKSSQWHDAQAAKEALAQSESYRKQESLNAQARTKLMDTYTRRIRTEGAAAAAARSDLDRLRNSLATPAPAASAPTCEPDRARVRSIADLFAESAGLLAEGRGHVEQLRNDRQALIEVKP